MSHKNKPIKTRHYFFLNPYENEAFTRCPQCGGKTKLRKYPLVIHIEPNQILCLNKSCKYCEKCDLIIGKQTEIESLMAAGIGNIAPSIIGNKYLVIGTLDKADWRQSSKQISYPADTLEKVYVFKDVKQFELIVGGWMKEK
jgi:hypothetical protein